MIRSGAMPIPGVADGEMVVEAMLSKRFSVGKPSSWQPDNNPETGEWFWKDVEAMAEFAGGKEGNVQPVLVEAMDCEFEIHFHNFLGHGHGGVLLESLANSIMGSRYKSSDGIMAAYLRA
jgi:cytochrome oxidase assembly protein ShyY1